MSNTSKNPASLAVGAALAGGLMLSGSAFSATPLMQGYLLGAQGAPAAEMKDEMKADGMKGEMKAGEMKDDMAADKKMAHEGKCGEGKCGMDKMDTDKDGKISKAECAAAHDNKDSMFAKHDSNGDGFISAEEMKAHMDADKGG